MTTSRTPVMGCVSSTQRRGATLLTGLVEEWSQDGWFSPYSTEQMRNIAELGGIHSSFDPRLRDITLAARKYAYGKTTAELMGVNDCVYALADKILGLSHEALRRLKRDGIDLAALSTHVATLMGNTPAFGLRGLGRPPLKARKAFLDNIGHAWATITGQGPRISRTGARRSGPFFCFLRACVEPFHELAEMKDGALEKAFRDAYQE